MLHLTHDTYVRCLGVNNWYLLIIGNRKLFKHNGDYLETYDFEE